MTEMDIKIHALNVEKNRCQHNVIAFLRKLVSTPSPSKSEHKVAQLVIKEMRHLGYDSVRKDNIGNVIGTIGRGKLTILYDAHMDTVGIAGSKKWKYPPYSARIVGGKLFGRGASDDKGCIAAMVYAGAIAKCLGLLRGITLHVVASVQEELAEGQGMECLFGKGRLRPDIVLIGEPTNLCIAYGNRGKTGLKITVRGSSGHAGLPEKTDNVIYRTSEIALKIKQLNKQLSPASPFGKGSIAVTNIQCSSASENTTPDNCTISIDRRLNTRETRASIVQQLRRVAGKGTKIEITKKLFPAWVISEKSVLVRSARKCYRLLYGSRPRTYLWSFCTNGSYTMGERGVPTVGFGPGKEECCHKSNEYICYEDVTNAILFYALFPIVVKEGMENEHR